MTVKKIQLSVSQYSLVFYLIITLIIFFSDKELRKNDLSTLILGNSRCLLKSIAMCSDYIFLVPKGKITGDGVARWEALESLMEKHRLTSDKYTIIQPLFAIPLYFVGDTYFHIKTFISTQHIETIGNNERIRFIKKFVQRFNKFVILGITFWFYYAIQKLANLSIKQATVGTIFLLFGSFLIPHAEDFYSESLWTYLSLLFLSKFASLWGKSFKEIDTKHILLLVTIIALLIPLNPSLVVVFTGLLILMSSYRLVYNYRMNYPLTIDMFLKLDFLVVFIASILGGLLCFSENYLRRGAIFNFGYGNEGFSTPFIHGFVGQILSPTRGIVFFIPTFFWGFTLISFYPKTRHRVFINLTVLYSVLLLLVYSKWHAWHGAWYWGPRFLLTLSIVGMIYFIICLKEKWKNSHTIVRTVLVISGVLSFLIYKVGVAINQRYLLACLSQSQNPEECFWNFQFLPYQSLINAHDIMKLLSDRSTLVEIIGITLVAILIKFTILPSVKCPQET